LVVAAFAGRDLVVAAFADAAFVGAALAGADVAGADFAAADLVAATFAGTALVTATFAGVTFAGAALAAAAFAGAVFAGAAFPAAAFAGAVFAGELCAGAVFAGAGFGWAVVVATAFAGVAVARAALLGAVLEAEGAFVAAGLLDARVSGATFAGAVFLAGPAAWVAVVFFAVAAMAASLCGLPLPRRTRTGRRGIVATHRHHESREDRCAPPVDQQGAPPQITPSAQTAPNEHVVSTARGLTALPGVHGAWSGAGLAQHHQALSEIRRRFGDLEQFVPACPTSYQCYLTWSQPQRGRDRGEHGFRRSAVDRPRRHGHHERRRRVSRVAVTTADLGPGRTRAYPDGETVGLGHTQQRPTRSGRYPGGVQARL
jgi:hypothetical protein